MKRTIGQSIHDLMTPVPPTAFGASGFSWEKGNDSDMVQLTGIGLVAAVLEAQGAHPLKVGIGGLFYVEGEGEDAVAHFVQERPSPVRTTKATSVIQALGERIAEEYGAELAQVAQGVECRVFGTCAVGATPGEAAMRAWLLHQQSQRGVRDMSNVPPSDAYPPVDLTLAYRELGELSKKDGDLGYEYWNSVIELLRTAGAVRAELAEVPEARRALQERRKSIDMLLNSTEWVTRTQIESAQPRNASAVDDWQRHGKIFSVAGLNGESLYPAYQFDPAMRPLPVISDVLRALGGVPDRWMVVSWFHFPNGWLVRDHDPEGRPQAPKDFLDEEAAVVRAARLRNSSYVA